jgi:hypothetical protein
MDGEQSPPRRRVQILHIAVLSAAAIVGGWFLLTRDPFPPRGSDALKNGAAVQGWDSGALLLADGRRVALPGLKELPPANSVVLRIATKSGVEVQPDGRVVGLVPVYSEWGSEGWHPTFRADLSRLLIYTGQGIPERPLPDDLRRCLAESPTVNDRGYEAKQFLSFLAWNDLIDQGRLGTAK